MIMKNRIARSITAFMLIICLTFSLSSCVFDLGFYSDLLDDLNSEYGENNQLPGGPSGNQNSGSENNGNQSENIGEFYPGSGVGSIEDISALRQTLLSTVIVVANNLYSPSAGSGVIYQIDKESGDAYVITNYHVIFSEDYGLCTDIKLYLYGMEFESYAVSATFVGGSINYDIALLRVSGSEVLKNSFAKAAEFADSESVRVFDSVYAVGNPEGDGISATSGIISVESENISIVGADGSDISLRVMRTDAPVNGGNSGGGLYDARGRLIGIVSAKRVGSEVDNMGYAIPSTLVKSLVKNIIDHCADSDNTQVNRPLLGITITAYSTGLVIDPVSGDLISAELVEVAEISAGSVAQGKIQVGDVITSVTLDGVTKSVNKVHTLPELMLNARVGSTVILDVTRGDEKIKVTFEITSSCITLEN